MGIFSVAPDFNPAKPNAEEATHKPPHPPNPLLPAGRRGSISNEAELIEKTHVSLTSLGVTPTSRILIAVSGGPDSMALLHVLHILREQQSIGELIIAHINHGLRGDASGRDELLVTTVAAKWKLPLEIRRADTKVEALQGRKGIEETARKIRYEFFGKLVAKLSVDFVITAHTANDQAETVIMNMVRGAGVRGLSGIPAKRTLGTSLVVRPWLDVTREEIAKYIESHNIETAHDASNDELTYQRNRVRHGVIPAIEEAYPDRVPVKSIAGLAHRMSELNKFLTSSAEEKLEILLQPDDSLLLGGLRNLRDYPLHAVLDTWLRHVTASYYHLSERETHKIERFIFSKEEQLALHLGIVLWKDENVLSIERGPETNWRAIQIHAGDSCETPMGEIHTHIVQREAIDGNSNRVIFDREKLGTEIFLVRPWQDGDRIIPFGMQGKTKLVSDILNEAGIRGRKKRGYPAVVRASDPADILWIPGHRRSAVAEVTPETKSVVVFEWIRKE
jgi:tRNA(Ile)-lysidine synthase